MRFWHKFLSVVLVSSMAVTVVAVKPGKMVEAASSLESKINYWGYHTKGWNYDAFTPGGVKRDWCGDYVRYISEKAYSDLGYKYTDYFPVCSGKNAASYLSGSISTAYAFQQAGTFFSWRSYTFNTGCFGRVTINTTSNRNSYSPRIGDIVLVDTDPNSSECDHLGIIVDYGNGYIKTMEGNTGTYGYTKSGEFTYDIGSDGMYKRKGTTSIRVLHVCRPNDPTGGSSSHSVSELGSPWYPSDDFYAWIVKRDGWVHLEAASNHNVALAAGGNNSNYEGQIWRFEKQSNGTYVIYNQLDGYVLDAYEGGKTKGTNVITYSKYNGGANQQWYLYNTSKGVVIKAAHCDLVVDVTGGSSKNGTNIELWDYNATGAQLFSVYVIARKYTTPDHYAYLINKIPWKHVEATVSGNVQIAANGNDSHDPKQIWYMDLQSDNSYMISNAFDGKVLDCNKGNNTKGTNILTNSNTGSASQRFCLYRVENEYGNNAGGFIIRPRYSNHLVLDVNGGTANKGTNIQLWHFNFTDAQVFSDYDLKNDGVSYKKPSKPASPVITAPSKFVVNEEQKVTWTGSALTSDKFDARHYLFEVLDTSGKVLFTSDVGNATSLGFKSSEEGTYKLRVTAVNSKYRDYYSTSNTVTVTVNKKTSPVLTVGSIASQTYTGSAITPALTVKYGNNNLTKDVDYTVTYKNNINVGTAEVTIKGAGMYYGLSISTTFKITAKPISGTVISSISDRTYARFAYEPPFDVKDGDKYLRSGVDYTYAYSDNVNVGTATLTVTGIGNYSGTKKTTFRIVANTNTLVVDGIPAQTYTGSRIMPEITVRSGKNVLIKDEDYTVMYTDNINAGTATVYVLGTGNYKGSGKATFSIGPKSISSANIGMISDRDYSGSAIEPSVTVTDGTKILTEGIDYTVGYSNNINEGTATVAISGKGNYYGTKKTTFNIIKTDDPEPEVTDQWIEKAGRSYYADKNGNKVTGLARIDGKLYYFNAKGVMQSGWQKIGSKKYYFKLNAAGNKAPAITGKAKKIDGYYYAFDSKGTMMKSGVKKAANGESYYLKSNGKAYTKKWYKKSGKWFYFGSNGKMVKNKSVRIDKKTYSFDKKGVCKNP